VLGVTFAYTKTLALLGVAQVAIRVPLTFLIDPVPFSTNGVFWGGATAFLAMLIIGPVIDAVSWARHRFRVVRVGKRLRVR
jgi:hypothetical protein